MCAVAATNTTNKYTKYGCIWMIMRLLQLLHRLLSFLPTPLIHFCCNGQRVCVAVEAPGGETAILWNRFSQRIPLKVICCPRIWDQRKVSEVYISEYLYSSFFSYSPWDYHKFLLVAGYRLLSPIHTLDMHLLSTGILFRDFVHKSFFASCSIICSIRCPSRSTLW